MNIEVQSYPVMPTRPCAICLALQGGSVFADFDVDDTAVISLRRISFDGYGCCQMPSAGRMNADDSRLLLDALANGDLTNTRISEVLRRYFRQHQDLLWSDALAENDLI